MSHKPRENPTEQSEIPKEELADLKNTLASAEETADAIRKSKKLTTEEKAKRLKETADVLRADIVGTWLSTWESLYPSQKDQIQKIKKQVEAKAKLYENQADEILKSKKERQKIRAEIKLEQTTGAEKIDVEKIATVKKAEPQLFSQESLEAYEEMYRLAEEARALEEKEKRQSGQIAEPSVQRERTLQSMPPLSTQAQPEPQPQPHAESSPRPVETVQGKKDALPKLNNHGHVSITLTGGRSTKETSRGGGLFDSINQLVYDPETNTLAVVEISRDIIIKGKKLNARTKNNPKLLGEEVAKLTKENVDYNVNLTLETAEQLAGIILETLGPIEVKQDEAIVCQMKEEDKLFYYFPKNPTIKNAKEMVKYAQFRYGWRVNEEYQNDQIRHGRRPKQAEVLARYSSNTHRQLRQSALMKGILEKFKKLNAYEMIKVSAKIPQILSVFQGSTNIPPEEIGKFLYMAERLKNGGRIERISVKGKIAAIWSESDGIKKYKGEKLISPDIFEKAIEEAFRVPQKVSTKM